MMVANLSFVYAQNSNFHIPKYVNMEGDIEVHHKGYSALFNSNHFFSRWVGYKLQKSHLNKKFNKRKYPKVDPSINLTLIESDSGISSFCHYGHLVPNRHSLYEKSTACEAAYYTNLVRINPELNKSYWSVVESMTSYLAERFDSVFIISGPIVDKNMDLSSLHFYGPDELYKVILIKTLEEYQAIGFVFPNDYCLNYASLYDYTQSIYEIEKLTNLQFFNDLDVSIQRKIKSEVYSEFWTNLFGEELNKIPKKYSFPSTK